MSSRQSSSFRRKYSRCRSFMKGSLSVGRYTRSICGEALPFLTGLSSALPFLVLTNIVPQLRTHAGAGVVPKRLAYISRVDDRDNNDDDAADGEFCCRRGFRQRPSPIRIFPMNSENCSQLTPALASSTATRRSISASTPSSLSSPE